MNILVLNPGSSSIKYAFYEESMGFLTKVQDGTQYSKGDRREDIAEIINSTQFKIDAVGVRGIAIGVQIDEPLLYTHEVHQQLEDLAPKAPLHIPGIIQCLQIVDLMLGVPMVLVFDTQFHAGWEDHVKYEPVPAEFREARTAYHGLAFQSVIDQVPDNLLSASVICQIGSGVSVCGIRNGKSVDSSFSTDAFSGCMMATRSGTVSASTIAKMDVGHADASTILNKYSGLLGVSEVSDDMRELIALYDTNPKCKLAIDMFTLSVAQEVMKMAATVGARIESVIFSGGIGENSSFIREHIATRLQALGFMSFLVIKADEELVIAKEVVKILQ